MPEREPFAYQGDEARRAPVLAALRAVVDPESALSIVDMGLVVSVAIDAQEARVELVMTSAACPVADLILEDVEHALDRVLPPELLIRVGIREDIEWTPERMTESGRRFMRW